MSNISDRLNDKLDRLMYESKVESGNFLNKDDIRLIFETLKKADLELSPLFETMEKMIDKLYDTDHYFVKTSIKEMLEYYNIVENTDMMKRRNKFYFTESKKLTKKPFFSPAAIEKIRSTFKTNRIFQKI